MYCHSSTQPPEGKKERAGEQEGNVQAQESIPSLSFRQVRGLALQTLSKTFDDIELYIFIFKTMHSK